MCVSGVGIAKFECDTAASHSVISKELFEKLQKHKKKLYVKPVNVAIRLADGTISKKSSGVVQIAFDRADAKLVQLNFFVVSGPNCLLERHALEQLWPEQFRALPNITSIAATTMIRSSHQPVPVKQTEKVSLSSHQPVTQGAAIQSVKTPATVAAQTQLP